MALAGRPTATDLAVRQQSLREAIAEAFGHRSFNLLVAGFFVCGFQLAFVTTHLPPYLVDIGLPISLAAWALALIGLCNVFGSLASGWIGQAYSKPIVLALIYLARSAAIVFLLLTPPSAASVLTFAAVMGFLWLSTVPLTMALVAIMFGPRYLATLSGVVFFSHQVGSFLGVWLGGRLYDQTGSYDIVWWLGAALGVFAAIVHWPIREAPANAAVTA
jgi:predicted MFS family arabinose efflux permease